MLVLVAILLALVAILLPPLPSLLAGRLLRGRVRPRQPLRPGQPAVRGKMLR